MTHIVGVRFSGMSGYNNSIRVLNRIGEKFNNVGKFENARSIKFEDINTIAGIDYRNFPYGTEITYKMQNNSVYYKYSGIDWTENTEGISDFYNPENNTKLENGDEFGPVVFTHYSYISDNTDFKNKNNIIDMFLGNNDKKYFLANKSVYCSEGRVSYCISTVINGGFNDWVNPTADTYPGMYDQDCGVMSVVRLNSSITPVYSGNVEDMGIDIYKIGTGDITSIIEAITESYEGWGEQEEGGFA